MLVDNGQITNLKELKGNEKFIIVSYQYFIESDKLS